METLNTMPSWERAEKYEKMYDEELTKRIEFEDKCINLQSKIDKAVEILGKYKHLSSPTEEQANEQEEIVSNTYDILKEDKFYPKRNYRIKEFETKD